MNLRSIIFSGTLLVAGPLVALTPTEWRFNQSVDVPAAGLVRLQLPPETLDAGRPELEDLRILDSTGAEVPFLLDRPAPRISATLRPKELRTELEPTVTRISLTTGMKMPVRGVMLEAAPGPEFIKAASVEGSHDGSQWQQLANSQPIFRTAGGAANLRIVFAEGLWEFLRLTIDDSRAPAVPFTGVQLEAAEANPPGKAFPVTIKSRDESPGKTRLALDLGAANLPVASITIDSSDPLFTRTVTIAVPNLANDTIREETLGTGSIYRIDLNGKVESRLTVPVELQVRSHELIVLIDNGDSPPLAIKSIEGERRITSAVFLAREAGRYTLLSGNTQASAPRYDLTGLADQLKTARANEIQPATLAPNAGYSAPDNLAAVPLEGAKIDLAGWKYHKQIVLRNAGTQQIELDREVLARAAPDLHDLRIVAEDKQVPFVFEHPSITRAVTLESTPVKDEKNARLSRWSLKMPLAGLPVTRLTCSPASALFQREVILWENVTDDRGDKSRRELGRARWERIPNRPAVQFALSVDGMPRSDTLFLETDNGDNPPIELREFRAYYPVTRVVFKTGTNSTLSLYYGNPEAASPRYDVSLIADQLLRAERSPAILGAQGGSGLSAERFSQSLGGSARYIFWGVLGIVVIGLLVLISRLLPRTSNPGD